MSTTNEFAGEKLPTMTTKENAQDHDSSSSSLTSLEEEDGRGDGTPAMKLTIKKGDKKKRDDSKRETVRDK